MLNDFLDIELIECIEHHLRRRRVAIQEIGMVVHVGTKQELICRYIEISVENWLPGQEGVLNAHDIDGLIVLEGHCNSGCKFKKKPFYKFLTEFPR